MSLGERTARAGPQGRAFQPRSEAVRLRTKCSTLFFKLFPADIQQLSAEFYPAALQMLGSVYVSPTSHLLTEDRIKLEIVSADKSILVNIKDHLFEVKMVLSKMINSMLTGSCMLYIFLKHFSKIRDWEMAFLIS